MRLYLINGAAKFEVLEYDELTGKAKIKMVENGAVLDMVLNPFTMKKQGWKLIKES